MTNKVKQLENEIKNLAFPVKKWSCGHTEDEHCFADVMFCIRDKNWFKNYKKGKY